MARRRLAKPVNVPRDSLKKPFLLITAWRHP